MDAKQIVESEEFKRCIEFHGHICPGVSIGFRAVKGCMEALKETRAEDEELVAIVETDACAADAVQVMTGCTFGKGNFLYKDYGKMAVTLLSRKTGKGIRVCLLPDAFSLNPEHHKLMKKVMSGQATAEEREAFQKHHLESSYDILEKPLEYLFHIKPVEMEIPAKARIEPSVICDSCGEGAMSSKLEVIDGQNLCRGCLTAQTKSE